MTGTSLARLKGLNVVRLEDLNGPPYANVQPVQIARRRR